MNPERMPEKICGMTILNRARLGEAPRSSARLIRVRIHLFEFGQNGQNHERSAQHHVPDEQRKIRAVQRDHGKEERERNGGHDLGVDDGDLRNALDRF